MDTTALRRIVDKYEPYGSTLLCEPATVAEKSAGGIIIPEQAQNPLSQGTVIGVGTELIAEEWLNKTVMWERHSEGKLTIDGVTVVTVSVNSVILREKPKA